MSLILPSRRSFLGGIGSLIAAPAILKASSLMPIRGIVMETEPLVLPLFYNFKFALNERSNYGWLLVDIIDIHNAATKSSQLRITP